MDDDDEDLDDLDDEFDKRPEVPHCVLLMGPDCPEYLPTIGGRCNHQGGAAIHCQHCGESYPMPIGDIPWVVAVMDAFARAHADCEAKAETGKGA